MKIDAIKRILWAVDILIAAAVVYTAAVKVFPSTAAAKSPVDVNAAAQEGPAAGGSETLTNEEVAAIAKSGTIVPERAQVRPSEAATRTPAVDASASFEYKLIGTIIASSGPCAFFEGPGSVQTAKFTGDEVGGAKVVLINQDRVILERAGERFLVTLQKPRPGRPATAQAAASTYASQTQVAAAPQVEEPAAPEGTQPEAAAEEQPEEDVDQAVMSTQQYREYLENFGKYVAELKIQTHYNEGGNLDGLLLAEVPDTSEAYKRGFRTGDIIRSVQDVPVTDTGVAYKVAWDILKNEDYLIDIVIVRNGEEEVLTFEIWPE